MARPALWLFSSLDIELSTAVRLSEPPNIIMLGEIRTPATAAQAVLAGTAGTLVGATLHGNDLMTGLERLRAMLREAKFDDGLLSDGLAAIVHQSMEVSGTGEDQRRVLRVSPLLVTGAPNEIGVRAHLRSAPAARRRDGLELDARERALPLLVAPRRHDAGRGRGAR